MSDVDVGHFSINQTADPASVPNAGAAIKLQSLLLQLQSFTVPCCPCTSPLITVLQRCNRSCTVINWNLTRSFERILHLWCFYIKGKIYHHKFLIMTVDQIDACENSFVHCLAIFVKQRYSFSKKEQKYSYNSKCVISYKYLLLNIQW